MGLSVEVLVDDHSGDFGREFAQSSGAAVDGALHLDEINVAQSGGLSVGRHPVGGIKEKILAAKRAGITDIILSQENKKDIDVIKPIYLKGLTFHYVKTIKEVLDIALTDTIVEE